MVRREKEGLRAERLALWRSGSMTPKTELVRPKSW